MTYDIFTFFNELDLLEIRLSILDKRVDYFVIVEATETFSGLPKPLYYEENKARFAKWHDKIIHHVVRDTPKSATDPDCDQEILRLANGSENVPKGVVHWLKEFYQKESIKKALVGLKDDDLCVLSDADEIWNPDVKIPDDDGIYRLRQIAYVYYLNNRTSEPWASPRATKYKNIKNACLNDLRMENKTKAVFIENGGWHFTNMGGADAVRKKIESTYSSDDINTWRVKWLLKWRFKRNRDFLGRPNRFWIDESELPKYILDNRQKYAKLFKKLQKPKN